jgi:hypothetical protein
MGRKRRTPRPRKGPDAAKPPAPNRAFSAALKILHLDQQEAAKVLYMERGSVSDLVTGKSPLLPDNYHSKLAKMGLRPAVAGDLLNIVAAVDGDEQLRTVPSREPLSEIGRARRAPGRCHP